MVVYTLNLRVFWPLAASTLVALLFFYVFVLSGPSSSPHGCPDPPMGAGTLIELALAFAVLAFALRYCSVRGTRGRRVLSVPSKDSLTPGRTSGPSRRELLEDYYENQVRLSPHVLGHSKAHVAKLVSELVRAGRSEVAPQSSLGLRGDFVQMGSSYEEHKVGRPDCFDILVPVRLPRGLKLEPQSHATMVGSLPLHSLVTPRKSDWMRKQRGFIDAFLSPDPASSVWQLAPDAVLRWFYPAMQRCLSAVRYPFEQRCSLNLSFNEDQVLLRLTPRSDYICCHISMTVRLIPALVLGDGAYWVVAGAALNRALWMPYFPRQEQKLLGWLKGRLPATSCHLKCLQLVKALRDLSGQALDSRAGVEWRSLLSSYTLKTAWLRLLLNTPPEAWEEQHLVERIEDLLKTMRESLQHRILVHLFLGGDSALLPDFLKPVKNSGSSNLLEGFNPASLDMAAARLAYSWTHLHRLIRLGRPQRPSRGRGIPCQHIGAE